MYTITTYSNRFYVDNDIITNDFLNNAEDTIVKFNKAVFYTYNLLYFKEFNKDKFDKLLAKDETETIFLHIRKRFKYNSYYTNAIINLAEGKLKSQISNNKNYIDQTNEKIKAIKEKISKREKTLKDLLKMRERIWDYEYKLKHYKSFKFTKVKSLPYVQYYDGSVYVTIKKQVIRMSLYKFEYDFLNKEIKRIRNLIGLYKHRIDNLNHKIEQLKTVKHIIFGTKKFMQDYGKGLYTKQQFKQHKYKQFIVSGRHDLTTGNNVFICKYDKDSDTFNVRIRFLNGSDIILTNVKFPYKQKELIQILNKETVNNKMQALCFGLVKKQDKRTNKFYYQLRLSFDMENTLKYINHDVSTGIIGIDFNLGHLNISEIDAKGNLLYTKTVYYDTYLTSEENELSLRKALDEIAQIAVDKHKIIAVEDVNTYKSNYVACSDRTKQRKLNKALHSLPHAKYLEFVNYLRIKYCIDVIIVKPQYTSIIGRLKYANTMKLNSHTSASYVIARRALGFKELPLKEHNLLLPSNMFYNKDWSKWNYLNKIYK